MIVSYWPTSTKFEGKATAMVLDETKHDAFEVLAQIEKRMFPGRVSKPDPKFDEIMAARKRDAEESVAPPVQSEVLPPENSVPSVGAGHASSTPPQAPSRNSVSESPRPAEAPARGVRDTSMKAFAGLRYSGKLGVQQTQVLAAWGIDARALLTRQEIARSTGLPINAVCGRVNELLADPVNALVEVGRKTCSVTQSDVNAIGLASEYPKETNAPSEATNQS